jgi:hypothetical protein
VKGREAVALLRVLRENGHFADSRLDLANFTLTTCTQEAARFTCSFLQLSVRLYFAALTAGASYQSFQTGGYGDEC